MLDDAIEHGEDVVQLGDEGGRIARDRHVREAHEIEHEDGRVVEPLRRREARVAHFLVDRTRHDVQEELLDAILLALEVTRMALDHLWVRVEEILRLALLGHVVDFDDEVAAPRQVALAQLANEAHLASSVAGLGVEGVLAAPLDSGACLLQIEARQPCRQRVVHLFVGREPLEEATVLENDRERVGVDDGHPVAERLQEVPEERIVDPCHLVTITPCRRRSSCTTTSTSAWSKPKSSSVSASNASISRNSPVVMPNRSWMRRRCSSV